MHFAKNGNVDLRISDSVEAESDLRLKNQITVPHEIVRALDLRQGDRLVFVVERSDSGHAQVYVMPRSFAGIAPDAYGGVGGTKDYLDQERAGWES